MSSRANADLRLRNPESKTRSLLAALVRDDKQMRSFGMTNACLQGDNNARDRLCVILRPGCESRLILRSARMTAKPPRRRCHRARDPAPGSAFYFDCRTTRAAKYPAPRPLSMFITETPDAQEFSMVSRVRFPRGSRRTRCSWARPPRDRTPAPRQRWEGPLPYPLPRQSPWTAAGCPHGRGACEAPPPQRRRVFPLHTPCTRRLPQPPRPRERRCCRQ